ncbi:Bug family tripartite tricarboxylate transporter substrate binding protein [Pseudorhodoferax sp.]|uniref:Bug family tripartite tricarboxylate transporter substrate binding protein n=1 Tax=Pseudorhodoferax sp. TaxID=1993553 RepID=UPI002DD632BA|nr:tripartite tricarboxylate transporter substrate-binding protein [Pseudorhodoferax sp.]
MMKKFALACASVALALPALSQEAFPSRPIRIVVPYAAGGATDFVARTVGDRLSKALGQPVVVDNRTGAAGAIGAGEVARAKPDGYTLLMTITDSQINNTALYKTLTYDPRKDFVGITQVVRSPALVSTHPGTGIQSIADLQAKAAQGKARLSYGSWGIGGLGHLAGETLNRNLKAAMVHVPQRGEGPVVTDLLSGTIDVGLSSVASAMQHVPTGKVVPLAVLGQQRSTTLPNVPTMAELGFKDPLYDSNVWIGLLAPGKTPQAIVERVAKEVNAIVRTPEVSEQFVGRGFELLNTTPAQFAVSYNAEFNVITQRIRELGIEAQ